MKSKLILLILIVLINISSAQAFYLGGTISISDLILKQDIYSLTGLNLEMDQTQSIINFEEALTQDQEIRYLELNCTQDGPVNDLNIIGIIQRCTNNGHISVEEIIISSTSEKNKRIKLPSPFLFSKVLSKSIQNQEDTTIITDLKLDIDNNKFYLESKIGNFKPKIKGEIYVSKDTIKIIIKSAKISFISIKKKIMKELKKMEGQYPIQVDNDSIVLLIK